MEPFVIEAENEGLFLEGYPSYEEGFEALERNLEYFDVILLDGLFFETRGQVAGTEDESGLGMAIARINQLKDRKAFPWFVLSGKDSFTKGENMLLKANKAKCFDKTNSRDVVRLFEEMRTAASEQADAQLRIKYEKVLASCSQHLLGMDQFSRLFTLIKHVENKDKLVMTEDLLTPIRKIIERIFKRLSKNGIIPQAIISNKGWISGSSYFLANKHDDYEHLKEFVAPVVSENIYRLLNIVQDASHGEGELKLKVDEYLKVSKSDYLYRSCVYLLFDLLLWFRDFMEANPDKDLNKTLWRSTLDERDWVSGRIIRIAENGYGTFESDNDPRQITVPPQFIKDRKLKENAQVRVILKPSPSGDGKMHIKNLEPAV